MMSPLINKTKMVFGDHEYNFKIVLGLMSTYRDSI